MKDIRKVELASLFNGAYWANYHIICSTRFQYVYVGIPKTGSTTVRRILTWLEVDGDLTRIPDDIWNWSQMPIPQLSAADVPIQEAIFGEKYFRFTIVRNPYTRILSCYLDKIAGPFHERGVRLRRLGMKSSALISFNEFLCGVKERPLADDHWAPQTHLLNPNRIHYDVIGRFESFTSSIVNILKNIDQKAVIPIGELTRDYHATGALSQTEEFIGAHQAKIIEEIYDDDFTTFGYSRDPHLAMS